MAWLKLVAVHSNAHTASRLAPFGPGKYRVDWLMRDRAERVCSKSWEVLAETVEGFEKLASTADSSLVAEVGDELFYEEPPVRRARGELLHVKLLVNFTPPSPSTPSLSRSGMARRT